MNTEHTPGPWKPAGPLATHILDSSGRMIADVPHPNGMPSFEGYSNRDLIAAAPDLLEALDQIAKLYEKSEGSSYEMTARAYDMRCIARAAIAKAEGKS